ncbi:unnamed protein product, partial [Ectocarpus sp. 4 AP-2014]
MSPKLEAKQRAPVSRRGSRKGSGMAQSGGETGGNSTLAPGSALPDVGGSGAAQQHNRRGSGSRE